MNINERVKREESAHTNKDVLGESVKLKNRFSHILTYPSLKRLSSAFENSYLNSKSLTVLDYGCGKGEDSLKMLKAGARVYGIDISEKYINLSKELAIKNNFDQENFTFEVMDGHNLKYENNKFDLIIGNGILHHLDAEMALGSIHRVLKPGGRVIFREPLADNPLLKLFRFLTPKARTIDELPFSGKALKKLTNPKNWDSEKMIYCGLLSAPIAIITSLILPKFPNNFLLKIADNLECKLNKYEFFKPLNQYVLINLKKI